jgi:hypothetical protein
MKTLAIGLAFGLLITAHDAHADYFQLFDRNGERYLDLARVEVEGRVVYTDHYGRIELNLTPGRHTGRVNVGSSRNMVEFQLDGSDRLKKVRVP